MTEQEPKIVVQQADAPAGVWRCGMARPFVDPMLVSWLKKMFPDKLPVNTLPASEMSEMIGNQQVIRKLEAEIEKKQIKGD